MQMKTPKPRFSLLAFSLQLSAVSLCLAGCQILPEPQPDPVVRNFTLSGPAVTTDTMDPVTIRPVQMAGHLRNREIAVRISDHEVTYLEGMRWAEPLDEAVTQVLRNRLRRVSGGAVVTVRVLRCELVQSENNTVQLAATYRISPVNGEPSQGTFTAPVRAWSGEDPAALVGLIHDAVQELAEAIATSVTDNK